MWAHTTRTTVYKAQTLKVQTHKLDFPDLYTHQLQAFKLIRGLLNTVLRFFLRKAWVRTIHTLGVLVITLRTLIISAASQWTKLKYCGEYLWLSPLVSLQTMLGCVRWLLLWTLLTPVIISHFCDFLWTCCSEELPTALKWKQAIPGSLAFKIYWINHFSGKSPPEFPEWFLFPRCAKPLSVIELCLRYLKWALQTQRRSAGWSLEAWNLKHHSFRTIFLQWTCKSYSAAGREPLDLCFCLLLCRPERRKYRQKLILLHMWFLQDWPYMKLCIDMNIFFWIPFGYWHGSTLKSTEVHAVYLSVLSVQAENSALSMENDNQRKQYERCLDEVSVTVLTVKISPVSCQV